MHSCEGKKLQGTLKAKTQFEETEKTSEQIQLCTNILELS
jgi:hypothetical protein